ncbi:unnamed protein product [Zymoseptoria tritici ST99CH_1A5]|uniref:Major facilitator superfamily (MFS) profile domain-containing protein n=3 Tax=Zymoseptoria tritici TaxID=1047171 RepID=A0A1X7S094_ZYMT9|nr:unnamed protein product [Zymoseptoria tritici ST99CH_3D7]SMR56674.1 unnamed protein product [Zymoseptoria tritici ST99CH_1E4]SMR59525.1 unnamed protein product [Zymoseptoria tritici ST99CH_3D1]SMY26724.1 unnamed protein product [Zymoseptoria tritici ST99CH_1A5]
MAATTTWHGRAHVRGSTQSTRLFLLTFSLIGLQFCWGTEQTYATPYLLALGLSKGGMSLVWIAGPLSGLIMQPIIGMISDKSTSRWGRRRPFMVGGTLAVAVCLVVLGWAKEIVACFVEGAEERRRWTIWVAVGDIYVLDFVINIAQSTCRALVVDSLPVSQQQLGAAWVTRMVGVGHMLVFGIGALDLEVLMPAGLFGDTQFKKVCSIAALAMVISQFVTCWAVEERTQVSNSDDPSTEQQSLLSIIYQIYHRLLHLPKRIQTICFVQFWSWIGWFPLLFYGSTWVGEIYLRNHAPSFSGDTLSQVGRVGSTALIVHSTVGFATSIVLPWLVTSPGDEVPEKGFTPRPPETLRPFLEKFSLRKPKLLNVWTAGNLLFGVSMLFAPMVKSVSFATFLMAFVGVPSAIAGLAVGTYIGIEVNKLGNTLPTTTTHHHTSSVEEKEKFLPTSPSSSTSSSSAPDSPSAELSGIYLGILNIYTTLPQFVGTAISWVVFSILEPGKSPELAKDAHPDEHHGTEGVSGIAVCLFIGALCSFMAAKVGRGLKED